MISRLKEWWKWKKFYRNSKGLIRYSKFHGFIRVAWVKDNTDWGFETMYYYRGPNFNEWRPGISNTRFGTSDYPLDVFLRDTYKQTMIEMDKEEAAVEEVTLEPYNDDRECVKCGGLEHRYHPIVVYDKIPTRTVETSRVIGHYITCLKCRNTITEFKKEEKQNDGM